MSKALNRTGRHAVIADDNMRRVTLKKEAEVHD